MTTTNQRFWAKVDKGGPLSLRREALGRCWIWIGGADSHGYGRFWDGSKQVITHRWAYDSLHGAAPAGLVLDHLCRRPACVRPDHLEAVTQAENVRRGQSGLYNTAKTQCPVGHPYDEINTRRRNGRRECRACARIAGAAYRARQKGPKVA